MLSNKLKALDRVNDGAVPLAFAVKGNYACFIVDGIIFYYKKGELEPIPIQRWMDQPEEEWKGLHLSKKERAERECKYQLEHYVSKQYEVQKYLWKIQLGEKPKVRFSLDEMEEVLNGPDD